MTFSPVIKKDKNWVQGRKGNDRDTEIQRGKEEKIEEEGNGRRKKSEKILSAVKDL